MRRALAILGLVLSLGACSGAAPDVLTISGSAVGREAEILRTQLKRFASQHGIQVLVRPTPDSADHRHQLYVQWLNARSADPDVLQLDIVWTAEFAAAGWLRRLDDGFEREDFFPNVLEANRWAGSLYAVPWFVDVGMLYWRTDLFNRAPETFAELSETSKRAIRATSVRHGVVWQAARYEGLVTVFLEHLGGFGGRILDDSGAVVLDSEEAVRALTWMRDAIHTEGIVPAAALTWHEEETRFAFQSGGAAAMRNWPYANALLRASDSSVAGRFAVAAMPSDGERGTRTAALGGAQLAVNARSRQQDAALSLVRFLTAPEQMLERAREVGQFPSRASLYDRGSPLDAALTVDVAVIRGIIDAARARPVTPVYTELSEVLQISLHRALSRQQEPRAALQDAARRVRRLLERSGLLPRSIEPQK